MYINTQWIIAVAIALNGSQGVSILSSRAYCFAKLERYAEAISDYTRIIRMDPSNASAFHNRGVLHDKIGQIANAKYDYVKASQCQQTHKKQETTTIP